MTKTPGHGAERRSLQGRLDAAVEWTIGRTGAWYVHVVVGASYLMVVLLTVPIQDVTILPLWTGGVLRLRYVEVFTLVAAFVGLPVMFGIVLRRLGVVVRHLRGEPVDPVELWRTCVTRMPGLIFGCATLWMVVVAGPVLFWVGRSEHYSVTAHACTYLLEVLASAGAMAFYLMLYEVAFLPIARDAARRLPTGFSERSPVTGRARLVVLGTTVTLTTGCEAAGLTVGFTPGTARIWAVALVTVGLVSTYVGALLMLLSSSVTRRVHELADALNRVSAGEQPVRMLQTSGDEFDAVATAFNSMVGLLREHAQELRTSRSRLVAVADHTRRAIERDLHDGAQQHLALVSVQLGRLEHAARGDDEVEQRVHVLRAELGAVVAQMRSLAHGIYPAALEAEGLASALRAAGREAEVPVTLDLDLDLAGKRWATEIETAAYFCCWELIQRARHAEVPDIKVGISIREVDGWAIITLTANWRPPSQQIADLERFLQDRLGAVAGVVASVAALDGGIAYVGSVPL